MLSPSQTYTLQDIEDNFAEPELHAAPALIDSIAKVQSGADHISGELRGKPSPRIKLDIYFDQIEANGQTTLSIDSECTCPRVENCAHAAATLLFLLDQADIAASTGSACQAGVAESSHVVQALGRTDAEARQVLRFTLGRTSTEADVDALLAALPDTVARARTAFRLR